MKKVDFVEKMASYGINLSTLSVYIDKEVGVAFSLGAYCDGHDWVLYTINERNEKFEYFRGTENEVFEELYTKVFVRLDELNYVTNSITKEVIKTDKAIVMKFLNNKCNMDQEEAERTWKYLVTNFNVLNEVKYYALNDCFVPDCDCYKVSGYSACKLNERKDLELIDAFIYLVYMQNQA